MRLILLFLMALLAEPTQSQIVLGRQVVGTTSVNGTASSVIVRSTAGESAVQRFNSENTTLTQGFQQPAIQPFLVEFEVVYADCWNGQNAALNFSALSGCGGEYEVLLVNNQGSAEALDGLSVGAYTLTVTAAGGCVFETEITVETPAIAPCDLQVYNVVTPNADGANDTWFIEGIELPKYAGNEVRVFNRWGQLVWSTRDYSNDGNAFSGKKSDGSVLPEGAYMYEITWGEGKVVSGTINLLQ